MRYLFLASLLFNRAIAIDLGIYGHLFPVIEVNPVTVIQSKLKTYEQNGELQAMQEKMHKQVEASILRPMPVKGLTRAIKDDRKVFTPSLTLQSDIYDAVGNKLFAKGLTINPWDSRTYPESLQQLNLTVPKLSKTLLIFDGDDAEQCAWVEAQIAQLDQANQHYKLILVGGHTRDTAERLQRQVYFDQNGQITRYFNIKHLPVLIVREDNHCVIQTFAMRHHSKQSEATNS